MEKSLKYCASEVVFLFGLNYRLVEVVFDILNFLLSLYLQLHKFILKIVLLV